jgi:hypothetical protein
MKVLLMGYRLQLQEEKRETRAKVTGKGLQKCLLQWYGHWLKPVPTERNC